MDVEYHYHCVSAERFATQVDGRNDTYTVRRDRNHKYQDEVEIDWSCNCPQYRFRCGSGKGQERYCKHIKHVKENTDYCGWMQYTDGGNVDHDDDGNPICPNCSEKVISLGWAV